MWGRRAARQLDQSAPNGVVPGSHVKDCSTGTGLVVKGVVLVFASMLLLLTPRAFAQDEPMLAIAVGAPGSPSYKFGLGLSSLLQAEALPDGTKMRIEIWESLSPSERIAVLLEEVQLAVIRAGDAEREDPRARQQIRAAVGLADGNQVLVRADLSDDLVYSITRLVFEHSDLMRSAYPDVGDLEPSASLMRIQGGAHPGALRYYEEQRELQLPAALPGLATDSPPPDLPIADLPATALPAADLAAADDTATALPEGKSFAVYFDFDSPEFDTNQIGLVQEPCGYAATLPAAEFILSGDADTVGPEAYNGWLARAWAQSVASVIRSDPRFRDALNVIKFGEHNLAVSTADEVEMPPSASCPKVPAPAHMRRQYHAHAPGGPELDSTRRGRQNRTQPLVPQFCRPCYQTARTSS